MRWPFVVGGGLLVAGGLYGLLSLGQESSYLEMPLTEKVNDISSVIDDYSTPTLVAERDSIMGSSEYIAERKEFELELNGVISSCLGMFAMSMVGFGLMVHSEDLFKLRKKEKFQEDFYRDHPNLVDVIEKIRCG
jgi:hypothetical protein